MLIQIYVEVFFAYWLLSWLWCVRTVITMAIPLDDVCRPHANLTVLPRCPVEALH